MSQLLPVAVQPLLMIGGAYLCFEGFEKVFEKLFHRTPKHEVVDLGVVPVDEKEKIKGAVRTDFILSAEIIVISLGTVAAESLLRQFSVLLGISVVMTIGVYGFVGFIVKLDDAGFYFARKPQALFKTLGRGLLAFAPKLMRFLGFAGTIAMFLVGGGILAHGVPALHHLEQSLGSFAMALQLGLGVLIGGAVFAVVHVVQSIKGRGIGA